MEELFLEISNHSTSNTALLVESNPNLSKKFEIFLAIFLRFIPSTFSKLFLIGSDLHTCQKLLKKFLKARVKSVLLPPNTPPLDSKLGQMINGVEKMHIDQIYSSFDSKMESCIADAEVVVLSQDFLFRKGKDYVKCGNLVVFEDTLQIDVKAIDHLSINIDLKLISAAIRGIQELMEIVEERKEELEKYYECCKAGNLFEYYDLENWPRGVTHSSQMKSTPVPGNLRRSSHFLKTLKTACVCIRQTLRALEPSINSCDYFLFNIQKTWLISPTTLSYSSFLLCTLLNFLHLPPTQNENYFSLYTVCEFFSLSSCQSEVYSVIYEPHSEQASARNPVLQLSCCDPSHFLQTLLSSFTCKVLFTSLSAKLSSNFLGVESKAFIYPDIPDICSLILIRGSDQMFLSTKSEEKVDDGVIRNYGEVLLDLSEVVPDGLVAIFPDWKTLISYIVKWNESGLLLRLLEHKLVFIENTENEMKLMKNFEKACECGRGAVFITVAREKCLELLNRFGKFVRCSLVFGVPQGGVLSRVLRARLTFLKKNMKVDEGDYLNYDAMRDAVWAVAQGVKSSSPNQAIIFVDRRFDSVQKKSKIPEWIIQKFKSQNSVSKDSAKDICSKYFKRS